MSRKLISWLTFIEQNHFLSSMAALKLIIVFVIIIIALRKKVPVGITLFGAGAITALLYQLDIMVLLDGYWQLLKSKRFISLTAVIILITILGSLLKELKFLEKLSSVCNGLYGGSRTAVIVLPGLIGLMPMPGGSLLSAPLVNDVMSNREYPAELKMVTNYWFRHIVEFFWPIYPGLILTEAITGMPIYKVSLLQFPLAFIMVVIGIVFFIRRISVTQGKVTGIIKTIEGIITTIWPIILAIIIYGLLKIELAFAVLISILLLIITAKPKKKHLAVSIRSGLSYNLIFLVFGILSFQTVLELTGAIESIPKLAVAYNLPAELVIFLVCFTAGIMTGMVSAYVGLGYSLLAGFIYQPEIVPGYIFLAYLSGYVGVMLSPTHLCFILTNEFFGSNLLKVYKKILLPFILLLLSGYLIYLTPWSNLFLSY